jgi:quercetin dioxygenase-like cupin family protein
MNHSSSPGLRLENIHTGEVLEMLRLRENGETVLEIRGTLPPREEGPPMHVHHVEDEDGTVTAGTLTVEVGGKRFELREGESAQLPRGVPHRWWNAGDVPLAFVGYARPVVDLDRFLQAVFEIMNAGPRGRPSLFCLAHVMLRHRRTQSALLMSPPLQAIVFRAAVVLGTLLGKYRGTDWPGCPDRCTGAPEMREVESLVGC